MCSAAMPRRPGGGKSRSHEGVTWSGGRACGRAGADGRCRAVGIVVGAGTFTWTRPHTAAATCTHPRPVEPPSEWPPAFLFGWVWPCGRVAAQKQKQGMMTRASIRMDCLHDAFAFIKSEIYFAPNLPVQDNEPSFSLARPPRRPPHRATRRPPSLRRRVATISSSLLAAVGGVRPEARAAPRKTAARTSLGPAPCGGGARSAGAEPRGAGGVPDSWCRWPDPSSPWPDLAGSVGGEANGAAVAESRWRESARVGGSDLDAARGGDQRCPRWQRRCKAQGRACWQRQRGARCPRGVGRAALAQQRPRHEDGSAARRPRSVVVRHGVRASADRRLGSVHEDVARRGARAAAGWRRGGPWCASLGRGGPLRRTTCAWP